MVCPLLCTSLHAIRGCVLSHSYGVVWRAVVSSPHHITACYLVCMHSWGVRGMHYVITSVLTLRHTVRVSSQLVYMYTYVVYGWKGGTYHQYITTPPQCIRRVWCACRVGTQHSIHHH